MANSKKNTNNEIEYELHWYKDWASWNLINQDKYEIKMKGKTTLPKYINQIRNNLIKIYVEFGLEKYKMKWIEHEFPLAEYEKIK